MNPESHLLGMRPAVVLALAAALLLSAWASLTPESEPPAEAVVSARASPPAMQSLSADAARETVPVPGSVVRSQAPAWPALTRQQRLAWEPAPPEPAKPPPPPPPVPAPITKPAPPVLPYRFIGRLEEGSHALALLDGPMRSLAVKAGDVLDSQWRVDRIDGALLHLTWLPDSSVHTLRLAAAPTP